MGGLSLPVKALIFNFASGGFPLSFNDSSGHNKVEAGIIAGTTTALYSPGPAATDDVQILCHDQPARSISQIPYLAITPSWQALTLGTNITDAAGKNAPSAALIGPNLLLLSGAFTTSGAIAGNAVIFTLPSSSMFPPTNQLRFAIGDNNQDATPAGINTSGQIFSVSGLGSGVTVGLDGIILRVN